MRVSVVFVLLALGLVLLSHDSIPWKGPTSTANRSPIGKFENPGKAFESAPWEQLRGPGVTQWKKEFTLGQLLAFPSFVSSGMQGRYKIFVNGYFVGGGFADSGVFTLDASLVKAKNEFVFMTEAAQDKPPQVLFSELDSLPVPQSSMTGYFVGTVLLMGFAWFASRRFIRKIHFQGVRDRMLLTFARGLSEHADLDYLISQLQKDLCQFLEARRSTLYLFQDTLSLKSIYTSGSLQIQKQLRCAPSDQGPIAYVQKTKEALLVTNLSRDLRFTSYFQNKEKQNTYQSNSCVVLPLLYAGECVGVLTFADKKDATAFTRDEFELLRLVSKDFSFLLAHQSFKTQMSHENLKIA